MSKKLEILNVDIDSYLSTIDQVMTRTKGKKLAKLRKTKEELIRQKYRIDKTWYGLQRAWPSIWEEVAASYQSTIDNIEVSVESLGDNLTQTLP